MKEELIRVLNNKLNNITGDIDSLKELNKKIDDENEELSFIDDVVSSFNENGEKNPLNFDKLVKDDFSRALDIAGEEAKKLFNSSACNYDGLVYLISGIKNGVSISLTNEQLNGIEFLIQSLNDKRTLKETKVQEYNDEKSKFEVSDLNELKTKKDKYENVIDEINKNEYVKDIDLLKEAIDFSNLSQEETIRLLTYVLEYNAGIYSENRPKQVLEEKVIAAEPEEVKEEKIENNSDVEIGLNEENEFHFNQIENDNLFELPNITFDDNDNVDEELNNSDEVKEEVDSNVESANNVDLEEKKENFSNLEENQSIDSDTNEANGIEYIPVTEDVKETLMPPIDEIPVAQPIEEPVEEIIAPSMDIPAPIETNEVKQEDKIDNDFKDVIDQNVDYETSNENEQEKTSTRELHKIFSKYGIEENAILNELVDGDVKVYQSVLEALKSRGVLDYFKKNKELLVETLLNSSTGTIDSVLSIVKEDLSVDDEDYEITLKIVINTIPSVFILDGGNYDNFISNVKLFKELEINLINLFDFSKEIFVADHETIEKNLAIVNKYGFDINYKNAKYYLLIPNIEEKLDYYIESVYEDKVKNELFDGINYIKDYAAKLNVVTDETIKRLRYASVNGKKVFGNKPGSLSGEITNLKVHALTLDDGYLKAFFNNEFNGITGDEVREYVKLIHNSSNVGDYSDELDKLVSYRNGLRYTIEGINVSYNKVLRNYSVLRSYGIDTKKALQFAVCYNLVITKDEYNKLSSLLDKIGGNV